MNKIALLRAKHGLTQQEIADKTGMHVHAVGYAEHHVCSPKLARQLGSILDENPFEVIGSDVLKMLPQTEEDKEILIRMIKEL